MSRVPPSEYNSPPLWYQAGDIGETIQQGLAENVELEDVIGVLAKFEYEDLSRQRVRAIVTSTVDRLESSRENAILSQRPSASATPEGYDTRNLDRRDVGYLSDTEFAYLLMAVLSRVDGRPIRPEHLDIDVDLFWRRQHKTIALRTIARPEGIPVEASAVRAVIDGETNPKSGRNPSTVVVVTNTYFSDEALDTAAETELDLRDGSHLAEWLARTGVSIQLVGDLLEHGDNRDYDLDERLDAVESAPPVVNGFELLETTGYDVELDVTPRSVSLDSKEADADAGATIRWMDPESEAASGTDGPSSGQRTNSETTPSPAPESDPTTGEAVSAAAGSETESPHTSETESPHTSETESPHTSETESPHTSAIDTEAVVREYEPAAGRTGKLYANSDDDGDYDAFDKLMTDFEEADNA